jgi:hypothetical protein
LLAMSQVSYAKNGLPSALDISESCAKVGEVSVGGL